MSWNTASVAVGAAIYAYGVIPNSLVYEDALNMEAVSGDISLVYLKPEGGYIECYQGPGLGVYLDEAKLAKYPDPQFPFRGFRTVADERSYH